MPHPLAAEFAAAPWKQISPAQTAAAAGVPTMLRRDECQLYYWLAQNTRGLGATVDLGTFAGGSTAYLAAGLAASGAPHHHLHGYDRFTASEEARALHLSPNGIPLTDQEDILPLAQGFLSPWAQNISLHRGEIADLVWTGGPVELLVIDAAKSTHLADHIAAQFFPHLIPSQSLVVHQDFLHKQQPWLAVQMVRLAEYFTPLGLVARDCVVFACTKPVTPQALAHAATAEMDDDKLLSQIRAAAKLYDFIPKERFKEMIDKLRANPGARVAWQLWQG
ncbi:MAG: hypothetical protein U5N55_07740 [Cypionkella sp.]|nr:hypothetical protein [Cypionkella sp.]